MSDKVAVTSFADARQRKCPPHAYVVTDVGEYVVIAECADCEDEVKVSPKRSRDYVVGERL